MSDEPDGRAGKPQNSAEFGAMTAPPSKRPRSESSRLSTRDLPAVLAGLGLGEPAMTSPVVKVEAFGAKGDGVTDDTAAINRAIDSMTDGGTLVFARGKTYRKRGLVVVRRPNVKLWGYGAVLYSVVTDDEVKEKGQAKVAVHLDAPHTAVYGLTLLSNQRRRTIGHPNLSGIYLSSEHQQVIGNRLEYAGIFARKAQHFLIAGNVVYRSTADGIHMTTGSAHGIVAGNVVRENGDDMIAVVNYGKGEPNVGDVVIEKNDVSGQYWGRGISVVGGRNVTIRKNVISKTATGAGILVHSETSYRTANVRNVRIEDNEIRDVQTLPPAYNPARKTRKAGHGAIDVYGQGEQRVDGVLIQNNTIVGTGKDGLYVRGNSCTVGLFGNKLSRIGRAAINIDTNATRECPISCGDNSVDGAPASNSSCGDEVPHVTGAGS